MSSGAAAARSSRRRSRRSRIGTGARRWESIPKRFVSNQGTGDRGRGTGAVLVVAVAIVALLQSWQRWLEPIIDTGRDLYIPEQLARGAKLYRDLRYQYPPLAPYLLALMPDRSLAAYTILGILQSAVVAACLWLSLRRDA